MTSTRYADIDYGKALAMLAVFWGHVMLGGITNWFCYAFHIPLFFFLSGMVFRADRFSGFGAFFRRKVRTLLLPYVIFSGITWLYWWIRGTVLGTLPAHPVDSLLQTFLAQGSGSYLRHNVALWFVTALFVVEAVYYFLAAKPWKIRIPVLIFCGILGYVLVQPNGFFDFQKLPWNLEAAATGIVFYGAGHIFAESGLLDRLRSFGGSGRGKAFFPALCLLAAAGTGAFFNGHVTIAQGNFGRNVLLFYLDGALGIGGMLFLSQGLASLKLPGWLSRWLGWFGRHTFWAMAIHVPVMVDLVWLTARWFHVDRDGLRYQYRWTVPIFLGMVLVTNLWMVLLSKLKQVWYNQTRKKSDSPNPGSNH